MKKKYALFILLACIIGAGAAVLFLPGRKPFRGLDASGIVSAQVHLEPPGKTVQITDIPQLVSYLNEVVIYRRDDSYQEYCGQGVTFSLTMQDGTKTDIMAYNPFIVIDGAGYRTKYEPCEALNHYANSLLDAGAY